MPCRLSEVPRTILPPPITTPSETPMWWTALISSVRRSTTEGSMPKPRFPASASPESFSMTRPYLRGSVISSPVVGSGFPHLFQLRQHPQRTDQPARRVAFPSGLSDLEADEARHRHLLAGLRGHALDQLADGT